MKLIGEKIIVRNVNIKPKKLFIGSCISVGLRNISTNNEGIYSLSNFLKLRDLSKRYPFTEKKNLPSVDIEILSRSFLHFYLRDHQHLLVTLSAPIFGCGLKDNRFTLFSSGRKEKYDKFCDYWFGIQSYVSLDKFYKPLPKKLLQDLSLSPADIPADPMDIRKVFAMLSLLGDVTGSFMQLLILSFDSFQLTYKGKPIIGFSTQEGDIQPNFVFPEIYL